VQQTSPTPVSADEWWPKAAPAKPTASFADSLTTSSYFSILSEDSPWFVFEFCCHK
jgi:hypothetical protein